MWLSEIRRYKKEEDDPIIVLIGNKTDLVDARDVKPEEAQLFAKKENFQYIEISAKETPVKNLEQEAFLRIIGLMRATRFPTEMPSPALRVSSSAPVKKGSCGCS